jgi:DNA-directed RNA polymerase subunit RPC12/RpoP
MGTRYTFRCNKCRYEVKTPGGHDLGMLAVTDPYICKNCKKIVDVTVGEKGVTYSKEDIFIKKANKETVLDFYLCPECRSDLDLVKWDTTKRPCPRCDGKMMKDANALTMLWD